MVRGKRVNFNRTLRIPRAETRKRFCREIPSKRRRQEEEEEESERKGSDK